MSNKKIQVLMVEPGKAAYEAEINNTLADMQKIVGGYIQAIHPYEEPVALVCNDEGKLEGLPYNRALQDETGKIYDIIVGTFFVCGLSEDSFASLSPEHMEKFKKEFRDPELFQRIGEQLIVIKAKGKPQREAPPPTHTDRNDR